MDTPLDPAQRKGGRMKVNPVPHLATARGWAYRILTAKTPAERVDFRSKTGSFHSKSDHSLVKIERGTGGGYLLEKKFFERGEDEAAMEYFRKIGEYFRSFSSSRLARSRFGSRLVP